METLFLMPRYWSDDDSETFEMSTSKNQLPCNQDNKDKSSLPEKMHVDKESHFSNEISNDEEIALKSKKFKLGHDSLTHLTVECEKNLSNFSHSNDNLLNQNEDKVVRQKKKRKLQNYLVTDVIDKSDKLDLINENANKTGLKRKKIDHEINSYMHSSDECEVSFTQSNVYLLNQNKDKGVMQKKKIKLKNGLVTDVSDKTEKLNLINKNDKIELKQKEISLENDSRLDLSIECEKLNTYVSNDVSSLDNILHKEGNNKNTLSNSEFEKNKNAHSSQFDVNILNNNEMKNHLKSKKKKIKHKSLDELKISSLPNEINTQSSETHSFDLNLLNLRKQNLNTSRLLIKNKQNLPKWLGNPTIIESELNTEQIPISNLEYLDLNIKKNLKNQGIEFLFPVQLSVIPWLMNTQSPSIPPSDLCVSAPTGSGKTLAFVLPIIQSLQNRIKCAIRALVVLPVSDLAVQIYKVFKTFCNGTDLHLVLVTGQKSFTAEQSLLVKNCINGIQSLADIVVGTPGRILDHIHRTDGFSLHNLRYLVIDEADRMMEEIQQGWLQQVEDAVYNKSNHNEYLPRKSYDTSSVYTFNCFVKPLQKLLFSATLSYDPEYLHKLSLHNPKLFLAAKSSKTQSLAKLGKGLVPKNLTEHIVICDISTKALVVFHLIKKLNFNKVLCFTEKVDRAHRLFLILAEMKNLKVREISSKCKPVQRKIILSQFNDGKINVLVCSDLVARGMDINNVDCVISYDVPRFSKTYIHRIGRTARAGKSGTAITLLSEEEMPAFKKMLKSIDKCLPETINVESNELEPYISAFKKALEFIRTKIK